MKVSLEISIRTKDIANKGETTMTNTEEIIINIYLYNFKCLREFRWQLDAGPLMKKNYKKTIV